MSKHLRYVAVETVARVAETSPNIVGRIAHVYNIRFLNHQRERYIDAEDVPLLLGALRPEPEALLPDGDI